MQAPLTRQTTFSANIVAFCRFLRHKGFAIGPGDEAEALEALCLIDSLGDPLQMQACLKAMLAKSPKQLLKFDDLYTQYWIELNKAVDSKIKEDKGKSTLQKKQQPSVQQLKSWLYGNQREEEEELATYSAGEVLNKKDFSLMSEEELKAVIQIIRKIALNLARRKSRRRQKSRSGDFDLRKTIRSNMRRGSEILDFSFSKPGKRRLNMVLICDISRSMDLYSRFLIHFIYAFQYLYKRIETFVFSTHLQCVSNELRHPDFEAAMKSVSENVSQWSGGTRIGESLDQFVQQYSRRLLDSRTQVIILSDGWDTGNVDLISQSMQSIQRKSGRVVWLNPLAGNPDYQPEAGGMKAALPFVDLFASAHNIESLEKVVRKL